MRTVKEVSEVTGVSVRTLHWYDEIGLLKPTAVSEAGYRLYDDKALQMLQQILFFREFEMPLKEIKDIMQSPDFDKNKVLCSQKKMLELKRDRLNRLISSMEDILKGDNKMDFKVFDQREIEEMYREMVSALNDEQKTAIQERYGSMEAYRGQFKDRMATSRVQENMKRMVEWYGGNKDAVKNTFSSAGDSDVILARANRIRSIQKRLADKRELPLSSFEVKQIVGEYDFVEKQFLQLDDVSGVMLGIAQEWLQAGRVDGDFDDQYGEGSTEFIAKAIMEFYGHK